MCDRSVKGIQLFVIAEAGRAITHGLKLPLKTDIQFCLCCRLKRSIGFYITQVLLRSLPVDSREGIISQPSVDDLVVCPEETMIEIYR